MSLSQSDISDLEAVRQLKGVVPEVAVDLYHDCKMTEYGGYYDRIWDEKYIKMTYEPLRG